MVGPREKKAARMECMWLNPSSSLEKAPDDATCWICLDGELEKNNEADESNQSDDGKEPGRLYRQCACRGTSSYVHLSCLAKFVDTAKNNTFDEELNTASDSETVSIGIMCHCPICREPYNQLFSICLAGTYAKLTTKYAKFDNRRISAHLFYGCLLAFVSPTASKRVLIKEVLEVIRPYPHELPGFAEAKLSEMQCLLLLGEACRALDDMEGAMMYITQAHDVRKCFPNLKVDPQLRLIQDLFWDSQGQGISDHLRLESDIRRDAIEDMQSLIGKNNGILLLQEVVLAENLLDEGKADECSETVKSAVERSVQFLGQDHDVTYKIALRYVELEGRIRSLPDACVFIKGKKDWNCRKAVVAPEILTSGGEKFVCASCVGLCPIFTLASMEQVELLKGTLVQFDHITKAKDRHINGKRGTIKSYHANKKQYEVKVEDDPHNHHMVKPQNIQVVFERIDDV